MDALVSELREKKIGIVAHFYMDPEVQGVLSAARERGWEHVKISDSLVMADGAVAMADAGCETIAVLGGLHVGECAGDSGRGGVWAR